MLKHLLPICDVSHISLRLPFILSVIGHIRNSFISKATKEQLEAKRSPVITKSALVMQISQDYIPQVWRWSRWSI